MIAPDGTLYLDNSTLAAGDCSTKQLLRYGFGYTSPEEKAALTQGARGHESLAHYLKTGQAADALDVYENGAWCEACGGTGGDPAGADIGCVVCAGTGRGPFGGYRAWADEHVPPTGPMSRYTWENTNDILRAWFEKYPYHMLPFGLKPELIEVGFSFPLTDDGMCCCGHDLDTHTEPINPQTELVGGPCSRCDCYQYTPVVFVGRMDGIVTNPQDGGWYVLENKFTGRINATWLMKYRMDSQLSGYIWAAQQHTNVRIHGAYVNALETSKLPASDRKCDRHAVTYAECGFLHMENKLFTVSRSPEELVEWRLTALHLADRFRRLLLKYNDIKWLHRVRTQGKFHGGCAFCAFYDFCSVGRPLNLITTMLVRDPWEPWKDALSGRSTGKKP